VPTDWRARYDKYLRSTRWKNIRKDMMKLRKSSCERCGRQAPSLDVHHKTYDRLGRELIADLELLCQSCHVEADRERAQAGADRSAQALLTARIAGFAASKYGEDWEDRIDPDQAGEEFFGWLERRGEE
jgi:5-methylcytosine-specific restriction endonuclease McrA